MRTAPSRLLLLSVILSVALVSAEVDSGAQEGGFTETFDDPALTGWESGGGATVEGGMLVLGADGFAFRPLVIDTGVLSLRLSIAGDGDVEIQYRSSDESTYVLSLSRGGLELARRAGEEGTRLGTAVMDMPIDSLFDLVIDIGPTEHAVIMWDEEVLRAQVSESLPPGGLLLRASGSAVARIDSISFEATTDGIESPPGTDPTAPGAPIGLPSGDLKWVYTGGPPGGLGYDIRMDPRDPDVMYVTDAFAGAFKSLDGGLSWFPISNGITTRAGASLDAIPVFSLSLDPNDPDRLWVGTQFASDVFRSDDGGESWTPADSGIVERGLSIRGLTVQPGDSSVVYFAAEVSSHEWNQEQPRQCHGLDATRGVVYRSDDGGENWRRIWEGDHLARYVWIDPEDVDSLFVSTGIFDRCAANADPATGERGGVGVLRSRDGGATWEELGVGNGFAAGELSIGSLYMHPDDPLMLIAASGDGIFPSTEAGQQGGIYLTENGGDTWQEVLDGHSFSAVEMCAGNPEIVYAGALSGFFRSDDGGLTWRETAGGLWGSPGIVAGFPIDMQCDPRDSMRIFVNNYNGGNFLSEDGGYTWVDASRGYTGAMMSQIALVEDDPAHLYVSARGGFFASDDGGTTWRGMGTGVARTLEGLAIAVDPHDPLHLIGTLLDAGPFPKVSRDGGSTWYGVEPELLDPARGDTLVQIVFGRRTQGLVLASVGPGDCWLTHRCSPDLGGGIIRSEDGGETFMATSLTDGYPFAMESFPGDDSLWYAYVHPQGLYGSQDTGRSWQLIPATGLPVTNVADPDDNVTPLIVSLAVDPTDPYHLYAGFTRRGIAFSTDGGLSWESAAVGLPPEITVLDIAIDPIDPSVVYIATPESGVFRSIDGGGTWSPLDGGLLTRFTEQLALSADGSVLYVSTEGAGVFRLDLTGNPPAVTGTTQPTQSTPAVTSAPEPAAVATSIGTSAARQAESGGSGTPWSLLLAGIGGVLALVAVALAVWRRHS